MLVNENNILCAFKNHRFFSHCRIIILTLPSIHQVYTYLENLPFNDLHLWHDEINNTTIIIIIIVVLEKYNLFLILFIDFFFRFHHIIIVVNTRNNNTKYNKNDIIIPAAFIFRSRNPRFIFILFRFLNCFFFHYYYRQQVVNAIFFIIILLFRYT